MYFGMTNSSATFQALMNSVFADLIAKGQVAVYMDDIIYSKTLNSTDWSYKKFSNDWNTTTFTLNLRSANLSINQSNAWV